MKKPAVDRLVTNLQAEMSRAGGRLPSLNTEQKPTGRRNNSSEGEDYLPTEEGAEHMVAAAEKAEKTEKTETTTKVPPAGGTKEAAFGRDVLNFLHESGYIVDGDKKPRTWTNKFLDEAIPTAVTVGGILTVYAGVTLIRSKWGTSRTKALVEVNNTPQMTDGMSHAAPNTGSRKTG